MKKMIFGILLLALASLPAFAQMSKTWSRVPNEGTSFCTLVSLAENIYVTKGLL
jgi:hypothetical protein